MFKKIIKALQTSNSDKSNLIHELKQTPKPEKGDDMPSFNDTIPNFTHQADLLFLPTAKYGFKYLLVVVDDATKKFDAEPLKSKLSDVIVNAFIKIYAREILLKPKVIEFDAGKEFHGAVEQYFKKHNIKIRYAMTNRHRQQGLVEAKNHLIGKVIMHLLDVNELDGKKSTDWYKTSADFRKLIEEINKHIKIKKSDGNFYQNIKVSNYNKDILPQGTKVRVLLDYPIDVANEKRQIGKFRAGDIRWSKDVHTIEWNVLIPDQPPMYRISGEKVLRTRHQLQTVQFL